MSRLKNVGGSFLSKLMTIDGASFLGQMGTIPDTSRVSNFLSARRYLRVKLDTFITPKTVVLINGLRYIVAEHGDAFHVEPINRYFKLFEVDRAEEWYSQETIPHPVTGVMKTGFVAEPTMIYLSTQPKSYIDDKLHIPTGQLVAICNAAVEVGDKIGEFVATKVDLVLGVYLVEMKAI